MKILATLLSNLLSSHVDNYRDTIVSEKIVDCIVLCVNYLFDIYSDENTNDIINENVESVQFIFKTPDNKKVKEAEKDLEAEKENLTFWDRLLVVLKKMFGWIVNIF